MSTKVGMIHSVNICVSIRKKGFPGEQCSYKAIAGSEWCGRHQSNQIRFLPDIIEMTEDRVPTPIAAVEKQEAASRLIRRAWARWLAKRAGPLLRAKAESNNPFDFFSSDPIEEIPLRYFISFIDPGTSKGYCMDTRSVTALLQHAAASKEEPLNPFNRAALPDLFRARLKRHKIVDVWAPLVATTEEQRVSMAANDVFRAIEDLGYYTNPAWFLELSRQGLQRFYIELADIWFHRAGLQSADRARIAPIKPFPVPITTALVMQQRALRPLLLETCRLLVSGAAAKSDKQLGVMYCMGALSIVSAEAAAANPWIYEMFSPGVTQMNGPQILVAHPAVLHY
jgi:hypothetical protein